MEKKEKQQEKTGKKLLTKEQYVERFRQNMMNLFDCGEEDVIYHAALYINSLWNEEAKRMRDIVVRKKWEFEEED